jgi:hypothetical protein
VVETRGGQLVVRQRAWRTSVTELRSRQSAHIPLTADHQQVISEVVALGGTEGGAWAVVRCDNDRLLEVDTAELVSVNEE